MSERADGLSAAPLGLPDGWASRSVEDCISTREFERRPSIPKSAYASSGNYPVVDQGQSLIAGFTNEETAIHRGDLPLILFGDHTRAVKYINFPFATGADGTKLMRAVPDLDSRYLYFALLNLNLPSRGYNRHFGLLCQETIDVPADQIEQRAIADVLSKLQSAVELQDRIVMTLKELKAATMAKLFREGLRGEPLKHTEIGEIPESWDMVPMLQAAEISRGQVDPKAEPYARMIHVGPEDVEEATGRLLNPRTARELGLISGKYAFRRGDIVFSKIRPYLRKSVLAEFDGICSADMYPLRTLEGFETSFLHAVSLSESFTEQATAQQARTGIPKLNREQLHAILVPKPTLREQRDIGKYLAVLASRLRVALGLRAALNTLFSSMLQLLVTGQIRLPAGYEGASP